MTKYRALFASSSSSKTWLRLNYKAATSIGTEQNRAAPFRKAALHSASRSNQHNANSLVVRSSKQHTMATPIPPPSNPFDGFDVYAGVAAPAANQQQPNVVGVPSSAGSVASYPQQQPMMMQQPVMHQPPQQHPQQQQFSPPMPGGAPTQQWTAPPQPAVSGAATTPFGAAPSPPMAGSGGGAMVTSATPANPYAIDPFAVPVGGVTLPPGVVNNMPPFMNQNLQHLQIQQQMAMGQPQMMMGQQQQQQPAPMAPQMMMMGHQQQPIQHQQMVPAQNNTAASPWGIQNVPPPPPQQQLVTAPPSDDPFGIFGTTTSQQPQPVSTTAQEQLQQQVEQLHFNDQPSGATTDDRNTSLMPNEEDEEGLALVDVELDDDKDDNVEERKKDGHFIGKDGHGKKEDRRTSSSSSRGRDRNANIAPPPPLNPGRHHAEYLSQQQNQSFRPGLTSPLPQHSLVLHSGYVLSRISFRTVLLRKWKQTFWIQYGPTQLLFFRTFADYEDWLNNPYHTQKAREYLIKLRVDFVGDLKKSSVMGYQVTQIRRKPYGKKVM